MFGATTTPDVSAEVLAATSDYLPELGAIGVGAIAVGAGVLIYKRGWAFFKGLAK